MTEETILLFNSYLLSYISSMTLNDEKINITNTYISKKKEHMSL